MPSHRQSHLFGAGFGSSIGLLVLLGYALDFRPFWQVSSGLPGSHPVTALSVVLLGYGVSPGLRSNRIWRMSSLCSVLAAMGLLLLRLAAPVIGDEVIDAVTPFWRTVASHAAAGETVAMGSNTAIALLAIGFAEIFRRRRGPMASQISAGFAIGILFVALTGYLNDLTVFYGAMGPVTLLACTVLATVELFAMPRHGIMRALTARSETGRLGRLLLATSTGTILLFDCVVTRRTAVSASRGSHIALHTYQTTAIIVFTWILVTIALVRADRIDWLRRIAERSLLRAATTDALTGLLTRNKMLELRKALTQGKTLPVAKIFIDVDRFRSVNEALGQSEGDKVLIEVARRLSSVAGEHHVGRMGGDEFAILCNRLTLQEVERIGATASRILAQPFEVQRRRFHLTASIGIAHDSLTGETDLRQAADDAMQVAKHQGGNQVVTFVRSMSEARRAEVELQQDLYDALDHKDQLTLVYQPVVRVRDRRLIAVEALARWEHPHHGPIPPNRFIQLAETTGLILPLGLKLMEIAVKHAALWTSRHPVSCPVINVNVSPKQFAVGNIVAELWRLLERHGLDPGGFCIEVTESAFSGELAVQALRDARRLGFAVSMDDFGVGYSSLAQLPRLPIASVKLDQSFIAHATASPEDATMFAAVTQLAHALNLAVVAEGVENWEQFDLAAASGCDAVQGYLISRPLTPEDLEVWLSGQPFPFR